MKKENKNASQQDNITSDLEKIFIQTKNLSVWLKVISLIMVFYAIAFHTNENRYSDIESVTVESILISLFVQLIFFQSLFESVRIGCWNEAEA